jgi:hypothetical protein
MSEEESQLPVPIEPALPKVVPRKGKTAKEAERGLKKFHQKFGAVMKAGQIGGLSEFGEYLKGKGPLAIGLGFATIAAKEAHAGIERCNALIEQVEDPELKVRLTEKKLDYVQVLARTGADIAKMEKDPEPMAGTNKSPITVFPPNVAVQVVNNSAAPPEKAIES